VKRRGAFPKSGACGPQGLFENGPVLCFRAAAVLGRPTLVADRRADRRGAALRRWRHHAGHFGVECRGRSQARRTPAGAGHRADQHRDPGFGLFLVQRKGTAFIGNIFGPVMLIWFIAIGLIGLRGIIGAPGILSALSPHHALIFLVHTGPGIGFTVLGAAFLALTGAEAMYADMGHFGRLPVRLGWFAVVFPALVLNYLVSVHKL
jgi:K+ potassium transporter integral membrane domain